MTQALTPMSFLQGGHVCPHVPHGYHAHSAPLGLGLGRELSDHPLQPPKTVLLAQGLSDVRPLEAHRRAKGSCLPATRRPGTDACTPGSGPLSAHSSCSPAAQPPGHGLLGAEDPHHPQAPPPHEIPSHDWSRPEPTHQPHSVTKSKLALLAA